MADEPIKEHPEASFGTYIAVWGALIVLTVLTVVVGMLELQRLSLAVAMLIAAVKAAFVAVYFMHLRYERIRLYAGVLIITLVTFGIFIGLTFTDIALRY
jgi:cytochrome c oxidase subunit 4